MPLTKAKARKILKDKEIMGKPLTKKQKRFFGGIVGGDIKEEIVKVKKKKSKRK